MELVEAEGRRLLDAFNGLELSTLTRRQKRAGTAVPSVPSTPVHGSVIDGRSTSSPLIERSILRTGKDIDGISFKSNGSSRTHSSMKRTPSMKLRGAQSSALAQSHSALLRKGSISSMSTRSRGGTSVSVSHAGFLHQEFGSTSSVNLTRSNGHLPLAPVAETEGRHARDATSFSTPVSPVERARVAAASGRPKTFVPPDDDEDLQAMQAELADIRRRRAEVTARYDARLEYLRARLKGAELREKILRK